MKSQTNVMSGKTRTSANYITLQSDMQIGKAPCYIELRKNASWKNPKISLRPVSGKLPNTKTKAAWAFPASLSVYETYERAMTYLKYGNLKDPWGALNTLLYREHWGAWYPGDYRLAEWQNRKGMADYPYHRHLEDYQTRDGVREYNKVVFHNRHCIAYKTALNSKDATAVLVRRYGKKTEALVAFPDRTFPTCAYKRDFWFVVLFPNRAQAIDVAQKLNLIPKVPKYSKNPAHDMKAHAISLAAYSEDGYIAGLPGE